MPFDVYYCAMTYEILIALIGFAFASSITPGPNNLMLMASGANYGLWRTCTPIHAHTVTDGRFVAENTAATINDPASTPISCGA